MKTKRLFTLPVLAAAVAFMPHTVVDAAETENTVPVTVEYEMNAAKALIPSSLAFEGKSGTYTVYAYTEESGLDALDAELHIEPSAGFTLTEEGTGKTVTASVSQEKTVFTPDDIRNGETASVTFRGTGGTETDAAVRRAEASGTITVDGLSGGTWTGSLTFTVGAEEVHTHSWAVPLYSGDGTRVTGYVCKKIPLHDGVVALLDCHKPTLIRCHGFKWEFGMYMSEIYFQSLNRAFYACSAWLSRPPKAFI